MKSVGNGAPGITAFVVENFVRVGAWMADGNGWHLNFDLMQIEALIALLEEQKVELETQLQEAK